MKKRIMAILLTALMTVSLLGGITASAAATEKLYYFSIKSDTVAHGINQSEVTADEKPVWDESISTNVGKHRLFLASVAEFGSHGWKYFDVSDEADALTNVYVAQITSQCLKVFTKKDALELKNGSEIAVVLEAPSTAGFYKVSTCVSVTGISMYAGTREADKTKAEDYVSEYNYLGETIRNTKVLNDTVKSLTYDDLGSAIYSDGSSDIVVVFKQDYEENPQIKGLKLTSVTGTPKFAISAQILDTLDSTANVGDTSKVTATIDGANIPADFITLKSSDTNVITVADGGVIKAVGAGTAVVTATAGGTSTDFSVMVIADASSKTYYFGTQYVALNGANYQSDASIWNASASTASALKVAGFGKHGWKSFGYASTGRDESDSMTVHPYQISDYNIRTATVKSGSYELDTASPAFILEAPEKGFYRLDVNINKDDMRVYIAPYAEGKAIEEYLIDKAYVGMTYKGEVPSSVDGADKEAGFKPFKPTSVRLLYSDGVTPITFAYTVPNPTTSYLNGLKLSKNTTVPACTIPETLAVGNRGRLQVKLGNGAVVDSFVSYETSDSGIIKIDNTGVYEAVAPGKATLAAKVGDYTFSQEITIPGEEEPEVPAETPEYVAAFTPDETAVSPVTNSVAALAIAKDGSALEVTKSAVKNANGTYSVSTDAESGEYKFLYWAKGLENGGKKRIVSFDASFTYAPHNGANYLIAVYGKSGDEASKNEYYNANGQLLENGDTLPSMAGYGTAKGWVDCGDGIFVAEYDDAALESFNITVNGKTETYAYGDKVTCTADAKNGDKVFFGWRKTINGKAELVSISKEYSFNAWEDCTVEAVYADEAGVFSGIARKIVLGTFNVGGKSAIMAEFIGFTNVAEKGISLGNSDIAMSTNGNQFTIINDIDATNVSGYAILSDGTKVIYK